MKLRDGAQVIAELLSEKEFMVAVKEAAEIHGWLFYHTYDSRRSTPGFPDLVLVRPPEVIFVELKAQKGRVTAYQKHWSEALESCPGVEHYLWRPSDWDELVEVLG